MAFVTAYLDANDLWMSFQDVVVPFFAISGIVAAGLAIVPSTAPWSYGRRTLTAIAGILWIVIGLPVLPFAIAAAGCACTSGPPNYVPPEFLFMGTRSWIMATLVVGPVLVLIATSALPDRLRARRAC